MNAAQPVVFGSLDGEFRAREWAGVTDDLAAAAWPCERCGRHMLGWRTAGRLGALRHKGHGYCERCYRTGVPAPRETDPIVIERLARGDRIPGALHAERYAAFLILQRRSMSARQIAERLAVTQRTVVRWRAAQRAAGTRKERAA